MSRARKITQHGCVERYSEAIAHLKSPGDAVVVKRGIPRSIVMQCPDGCGEVITVNLDQRSGPAWRYFKRRELLTIYPSIWKNSGCRVHFIVWNDTILWCGEHDTDEPQWDDSELRPAVDQLLPPPSQPHRHFEEFASQLNAVPWEVLWACHALVRAGVASSSERGTKFGRSPPRTESTANVDPKG